MKKRIFTIVCFIFIAGLIFFFSSQPYHKQTLIPFLDQHLPKEWFIKHFSNVHFTYGDGEDISIETYGVSHFVEFFIRKTAHVLIFSSFSIFLFLSLRLFLSSKFSIFLALFLTAGYASFDEFHQYLTGDRTPMWQDAVLDTCAAICGLSIFLLLSIIFKNKRGGKIARIKTDEEI
jgi:VanZ family protein